MEEIYEVLACSRDSQQVYPYSTGLYSNLNYIKKEIGIELGVSLDTFIEDIDSVWNDTTSIIDLVNDAWYTGKTYQNNSEGVLFVFVSS